MAVIPREEYLKLSLEERFIKLNKEDTARAEELQKNALVSDLHTHVLRGEVLDNVPRRKRAQVNGFIEAVVRINEDFYESMELLGQYLEVVERHPDFMPAFCAQDFLAAK